MSTPATTVPGIDLDRLRDWIDETMPDRANEELGAELITGGRSNLTYRLQLGNDMSR
jgi:aminoglycoside phosphotransferase (APT) family kinase protein